MTTDLSDTVSAIEVARPMRLYSQVMISVSRDEFESLMEQAVSQLPVRFARLLDNIVIDVADLPDEATRRRLGLRSRYDLLGLYHGIPLTRRNVEAPPPMPDRIVLYQTNIQNRCRTRDQLVEQIRKTVLHEIGHHFGLDEDDLTEVGYG